MATIVDDTLSPIDLLLTRSSAVRLAGPGPSREQLSTMLRAAVTAPDHGRLRPWRFIVLEGPGREKLGELLSKVQLARKPESTPEDLEKARAKVLRAPTVVVLVCRAKPDHKVPVLEQQFAVAAAGTQLMLATRALGFGCNWKTGSPAYDPIVHQGLELEPHDSIIGFFYIGTEPQPSPLARAGITDVVRICDGS